jgi:hypothetical protein
MFARLHAHLDFPALFDELRTSLDQKVDEVIIEGHQGETGLSSRF